MKKQITSNDAPAPIGPYSQAIQTGGIIFISGQIPMNALTGELIQENIELATHLVMENLRAILREADMNFGNVVKTTIFLKDMNDFPVVNEIYGGYFNGKTPPPARETVQVAKLPKDVQVEISAIAVK
jgi:2-iminobutanoate/2-iminopropanoate deaminase